MGPLPGTRHWLLFPAPSHRARDPQLLARITRPSSLLSQSGSFVRFMETFKCGYFVLQFWWQSCVHSNEFTINLTSCNIATSLISRSLFASWYHHHHRHYFKSFTKAKTLTPVRTLPKKYLMFEIDRSTGQWAIWWGWVYNLTRCENAFLCCPRCLSWPGPGRPCRDIAWSPAPATVRTDPGPRDVSRLEPEPDKNPFIFIFQPSLASAIIINKLAPHRALISPSQ